MFIPSQRLLARTSKILTKAERKKIITLLNNELKRPNYSELELFQKIIVPNLWLLNEQLLNFSGTFEQFFIDPSTKRIFPKILEEFSHYMPDYNDKVLIQLDEKRREGRLHCVFDFPARKCIIIELKNQGEEMEDSVSNMFYNYANIAGLLLHANTVFANNIATYILTDEISEYDVLPRSYKFDGIRSSYRRSDGNIKYFSNLITIKTISLGLLTFKDIAARASRRVDSMK